MSNIPHAPEPAKRGSPMLFVIVLLVIVAAVLAFVAFHSGGQNANAQPAAQPLPAQSQAR